MKPSKFAFVALRGGTFVLGEDIEGEAIIALNEGGHASAWSRETILGEARPLNRCGEKFLLNLVRNRWKPREEEEADDVSSSPA